MWHRGWRFVARLGPGRARLGRFEKGAWLLFGPIKHLIYVRVNLCTPLDRKDVCMGRRKGVALSEAPAAKLRLERCAAQAESFGVFSFSF